MTFVLPLTSPFWFSLQIFSKIAPPTQFFGNFISLFKKGGGTRIRAENYVYSSKNLNNNI